MERELEVKILNIDIDELMDKVKAKGGKKIGEEEQINITINSSKHPIDPDLGYLRLRTTKKENGDVTHTFTFKEQRKAEGIRDNREHNVEVDDPKEVLSILRLLGYDQLDRGEKHRISYEYDGARFDFDTWDRETYPKPYAEIEVTHKDKLDILIKEFSINYDNVSTKSIAELKEEWKSGNIL